MYETKEAFQTGETLNNGKAPHFVDGKPTLEYVKNMRVLYSAMSNGDILHLSSEGDLEARKEALIRNIMVVDSMQYDDAKKVFMEIEKLNQSYMKIHEIPYKVGLGVSLTAGFVSIPLVFQYDAVLFVHDLFVSAEAPEPQDRESFLEIGSWSWAWMEPVLGQISFLLLTLQFARSQLLNMGKKPYGSYVKHWRAQKLIQKYPRYNQTLMTNFADSAYMH